MYSRLLRLRSGPQVESPSLEVECDLCRDWSHPDPLTYVFRLRDGVRWHDIPPVNGRALDARDVAFSLERLRTPGWPGATLLASMASVEVTDPTTVTVRLNAPDADFLLALAHGQAKIVAPEAVAQRGDLRQGPAVGTGPWVLAKDEMGEAVFTPNSRYFEAGLPKLQELRVVAIPENETRMATFVVGRVDLTALDEAGWDHVSASGQGVERGVFDVPGTGVLFGLRATAPPLDQLLVRQAVFQALDPWESLDVAWSGQGRVALGVPAVSPEWLLPQAELRNALGRREAARRLLAEAYVPPGAPLKLTVADFGDRYLALGKRFQEALQAAGFAASLEVVNPRVYAERVWKSRDYQAFLGPIPPVQGPNAFLFGLLHSRGRWRITELKDAEMDRLIEQQAVAEDGRRELLLRVQQQVLGQAVLFMPVTGSSLWVWKERVAGFAPNFANWEYFHWARLQVRE